jgi:phosphoglycerate dehydrogenase-like enzyme
MRKALYFEILNYRKENILLMRKHFDVITMHDPLNIKEKALDGVEVVFAPLGYFFGQDFFSKAPHLKVIASNTTSTPHIDVEAAASKGVEVFSLKGEREFLDSITPTAELTVGLMIAVTRNLIPAKDSVLDGKWSRWEFGGSKMLSKMSLGIVGLGRLGSMVARYAYQMGMRIFYFDPYVENNGHGFKKRSSLEELVGESDIVSIHVHLTEETESMFSNSIFEKFKKGAYLINTSRGEIIDSSALIRAMETGRLRGAALDVLDGEFIPGFPQTVSQHSLVQYANSHPNLVITPHIAGSTEDAWSLTQRFVIKKSIGFFSRASRRNR